MPTPGRPSPLVVSGVSAILVILAIGRGVPALRHWNERQQARAEVAIRELAARRTSAADLGLLARMIASQRDINDRRARWIFEGEGGSASQAALARRLEEAAEGSGIELQAVQALSSDSSRTTVGRVRARATVAGDLEAVMLFLGAVEDGPERITIRELLLAQPEMALARSKVETVRGELVVDGMTGGPPPRSKS